MTYKQAYDKIIDAYFNDEIKPMDSQSCFCGTLEKGWQSDGRVCYTIGEYFYIEEVFLREISILDFCVLKEDYGKISPIYEDDLFRGMCAALEVLKQIHIDRGEVIDPLPTFTKRVFSDVLKMVK